MGCTDLRLSDRPAHPPVPDRGAGGRTGLPPRRWWSRSGEHLRGPATRGVGDGGAGHDDHRRPPTPVVTLPGPGRPHGCQRPHALLPHDAAVSARPERRVSAARSPTPARAVVRPTPRPCRGQGIAARPLWAAADARADVGWPAQRRCAARALMVHGSRFPRRGETGRGVPSPRCTSSGRPAATTAGWPYSAPRETPQAGPPRGSGLRRGNDGRVSGRTCPERTRRPTRR